MKYSERLISTPFPIDFFELGNNTVVEWSTFPKENPRNEILFEKITRLSGQNKRLFTVINGDSFFKEEHIALPALFIFHVSRCGSTLAANYFATDFENRVFNEPVLLSNFFAKKGQAALSKFHLQTIMKSLGLGLSGQNKLIVKFSSAHIEHLQWLSSIYPNVPKILIYRDPKEVLVSLLENPPNHLIQKHSASAAHQSFIDYCVQHLEELYAKAFHGKTYFFKCIDYKNLKNNLPEIEKELWGGDVGAERQMRANDILNLNSKNITVNFLNDSKFKQEKWNNYKKQTAKPFLKNLERLYLSMCE